MFYKSMEKNRKMEHPKMFSASCRQLLTIGIGVLIWMMLTPPVVLGQQNGKLISLKLDGVTLLEAMKEINRLGGNSVSYKREELEKETKRVSLDLKEVLVIKAVEAALENTRLVAMVHGDVILVVPRKDVGKSLTSMTLRGIVTDKEKIPMPGVTVKLLGVSIGTSTNAKGYFSLQLPVQQGTLEFSFVGFKTQKVSFTEATKDTLRITLEENIQALDETVVVAYGTTNKREMTGAVSVIKADEIKGIPSSSIANLLQGRVAGMDVTNLSGAPGGGGSVITIRGYNSLDVEQGRRFSNPLWVVDGVPLNSFTSPVTGTNLLAEINPDMIESIQILKDASSAAIYGSRAANGVILVTTKKGRKNQNATFAVNVSQSWNMLPELPTVTIGRKERLLRLDALKNRLVAYLDNDKLRYMYPTSLEESYLHPTSSYDYFFRKQSSAEDGMFLQDSLNPFYNNSTNFFPVYFEKAKITNANIQTYGGSERFNYGIGLGYYDESGILKGTGFTRIDLNSNLSVNPVKKLTVDLRFNASLTNRKRGEQSEGLSSGSSVETVPGDPYKLSSLYPGEGTEVWNSILEKLSGTKEKNRSVRLRANFKLDYHLIEGLNISTSLATDYSIHRRNYFLPSYLSSDKYSNSIGETAVNLMVLNENLVSYKKLINEDHSFDFIAGFSYQYDQMEYNGGSAANSPSDKIYYAPSGMPRLGEQEYMGTKVPIAFQHYTSDMQEKVLLSYFARLEYNYKKKYLFSASFRRDGSSVFGKGNKWGTFPSVAVGWTFTEERFMQSLASWFDFGKFRVSWGKSGMPFDQSYLALGIMEIGKDIYQGNGVIIPVYFDGLYNENLAWEETDQYDFGLDLDFLDYRLGVTLDYYYRYTDKMLMKVQLPGNYNGYEMQWRNEAAVSNEGIELLVKYEIFRKSDLYWKISVNGAKNWNRFEKSYNGRDEGFSRIIGKALNGIYVPRTDGFVNDQKELPMIHTASGINYYYASDPLRYYKPGDYKFVDVNGDGKISFDLDKVYAGSALPVVSGGVVNEFRWKNIDLNFSMSFQLGRHMINMAKVSSLATSEKNMTHPILMDLNKVTFWQQPGDDTDYPALQYDDGVGLWNVALKRNVEKVNWLKLKTLTVGYSLPQKWIKTCGIEQVRLFVSGENLWTFTNYSGVDPEIVSINSGIDSGEGYPLPRKFTLGLTVKF